MDAAGLPCPPGRTEGREMPHEATPHVLARRLLTHLRMTTLPPSGPLATAGASLASTIVVIDASLLVAVALALGVLAVGAFYAQRRRGRARVGSLARAPQVSVPYAALGEGR